jgi:hypothetical protein
MAFVFNEKKNIKTEAFQASQKYQIDCSKTTEKNNIQTGNAFLKK